MNRQLAELEDKDDDKESEKDEGSRRDDIESEGKMALNLITVL